MSFNSLVASLISNMKVAIHNKQYNVNCRYSKYCLNILKKFEEVSVIKNIQVISDGSFKKIIFQINVIDFKPMLINVKIISKPGCRVYIKHNYIYKYLFSFCDALISTNKGIMCMKECIKNKIGGELICVYL